MKKVLVGLALFALWLGLRGARERKQRIHLLVQAAQRLGRGLPRLDVHRVVEFEDQHGEVRRFVVTTITADLVSDRGTTVELQDEASLVRRNTYP